jgi:alkylation response protein AidB-like acyl-CoA dehydrogenase
MGIHGNATCVMNYDGATGWLVGEENKGLAAMFIMMNDARLGVGLQGLGAGGVAYQNAVQYARDRRRAARSPARSRTERKGRRHAFRPSRCAAHADGSQSADRRVCAR